MTTMEKLPSDITANILLRLPFKSLGRSKCVSKHWQSIISDPKFLITHLSNLSINPDILIFFRDTNSRWSGICYLEEEEKAPPLQRNSMIEPYKAFDHQFIPESHFRRAVLLGNSNGFVTLFDHSNFDGSNLPKNPIFIANPITGERAPLPHYEVPEIPEVDFKPFVGERKYDKLFSGFVYQESKKVFKLVLVMFTAIDSNCKDFRNEVQICTLGSSIGNGGNNTNWKRKSGIVPDVLRECYDIVSSAFVNECLHWITFGESSFDNAPVIVSFNLDEEKFGFVPSPGSHMLKLPSDYYELGVLERKLAVVECSPKRGVEIWVMEKYKVKESWVKKYSIKNNLLSRVVECFDVKIIKLRKNGELLLLYDREYLVCYNTKSKKCCFVEVEGVTDEVLQVHAAEAFVGRPISLKLAFGLECDSFEESILSDEIRAGLDSIFP